MASKRSKNGSDSVQELPDNSNKRRCLGEPGDTDVVVVIGQGENKKEFHHNHHFLCSWSGYFAGAHRSGMKEAQHGRFEFPHRDPDEWEIILCIIDPFDTEANIDDENVAMAISWFDELCFAKGKDACSEFMAAELASMRKNTESKRFKYSGTFSNVFGFLRIACAYELPCQNDGWWLLKWSLENEPSRFYDRNVRSAFISLVQDVKQDNTARDILWDIIKQCLPTDCFDDDNEAPAGQAILEDNEPNIIVSLVIAEAKLRESESKRKESESKHFGLRLAFVKTLDHLEGKMRNPKSVKKSLYENPICRFHVQPLWGDP